MSIRVRASKILALGLTSAALSATVAFAGDSAWLLGDNGRVAVNVFEYREGTGRATEVALIYGRFFLRGALHDTNTGKITLVSADAPPEARYTFTGTVSINYVKSQLILKGTMTEGAAEIEKFDATIRCKRLED